MKLKETAIVRAMGLTQIPLLFFVGPRVLRVDDEGCEIVIPLRYRTRNHLGSMYFGVLAAGADLAGGLNAAFLIREKHRKVSLVFKDFKAEFLKRADGDVHFVCHDGKKIRETVERADATGERFTIPVEIVATVPSKYGDEPVARFTLGLSLKRKG
ncbi:MAG: PaaI family thioesterase [Myxococcaceae bacterium]|nr:PaaI family thioesterase [Myxococcaceae bacterium]